MSRLRTRCGRAAVVLLIVTGCRSEPQRSTLDLTYTDAAATKARIHAATQNADGLIDIRQQGGVIFAPLSDTVIVPALALHPPPTSRAIPDSVLLSRARDNLVVVTLREDLPMPRFPEPDFSENRGSVHNRAVLERSNAIVDSLVDIRGRASRRIIDDLDRSDIEVTEQLWIINAFVVKAPPVALEALRNHPDVLYMDAVPGPAKRLETSMVDTLNARIRRALLRSSPDGQPVHRGRELIGSEAYYAMSRLRGGWVGLLDTGVNVNHVVFKSPTAIRVRGDCVNGDYSCLIHNDWFEPGEACGIRPHGTSSAAIITANENLGDRIRGVTRAVVDSWRVQECYPAAAPYVNLNYLAVVRGFQAAVRSLDKIILTEIQGSPYDCPGMGTEFCTPDARYNLNSRENAFKHGMLSHAANNAHDAGAVVISAMGNSQGQPSQPGNAHRALAVGAYEIDSGAAKTNVGYGPTADGRIKPDLIAPTNSLTADGIASVALRKFPDTSGAAPYVAGSATLVRNWLKLTSSTDTTAWRTRDVSAGNVYAYLILSGENVYPRLSDTTGVGRFTLPAPTDHMYWGSVVLDGSRVQATVPLTAFEDEGGAVDAALWWPERYGQRHSVVTLRIVDGDGVLRGWSEHPTSVFQRARAETGEGWSLQIMGTHIPDGPQVVYWAATVRE